VIFFTYIEGFSDFVRLQLAIKSCFPRITHFEVCLGPRIRKEEFYGLLRPCIANTEQNVFYSLFLYIPTFSLSRTLSHFTTNYITSIIERLPLNNHTENMCHVSHCELICPLATLGMGRTT
jgi:hypothetical protein